MVRITRCCILNDLLPNQQMMLKNLSAFLILITILFCSAHEKTYDLQASLKINDTIPMSQKKFKDADNTAVFTTKFVLTEDKEITVVYHEEDGSWLFFSDDQFNDFEKVAKVVSLEQITKRDPTLFEIADLPLNHVAKRKFKDGRWKIQKIR
ncbi:DUF2185 domain-containing protein [Chryseobacterium kwangjuense]|uniref:DUF2185 domain-containing protein n=1 Tax=Chryseobacterium kwangjuense TaxID=267125 RepID=A0ABW9K5X6_9FLAO